MRDDIRKFESDLTAFAKALDITVAKSVEKIAEALLEKIVGNTPNHTGRAQGNWNVSINTLDTSIDTKISGSTEEMLALVRSRFARVKGQIRASDIVYITNSLYYVMYLEHGTNKMRPFAMVSRSIEEVKTFVIKSLASTATR
jgi:HK97 gp10 family phage protein